MGRATEERDGLKQYMRMHMHINIIKKYNFV